jgi:hypothetical protein
MFQKLFTVILQPQKALHVYLLEICGFRISINNIIRLAARQIICGHFEKSQWGEYECGLHWYKLHIISHFLADVFPILNNSYLISPP